MFFDNRKKFVNLWNDFGVFQNANNHNDQNIIIKCIKLRIFSDLNKKIMYFHFREEI